MAKSRMRAKDIILYKTIIYLCSVVATADPRTNCMRTLALMHLLSAASRYRGYASGSSEFCYTG
jgi:hypothetical protein